MKAEDLLLAFLALIAAVAVGVPALLALKKRQQVASASTAIRGLQELNVEYRQRLRYHPPIQHKFADVVTSKAKFDRYDLSKFFMERLAVLDTTLQAQIDERLSEVATFADYTTRVNAIAAETLGRSGSQELDQVQFDRIEAKLFSRTVLTAPTCLARVECVVTYTSPQGQNSYTKSQAWDFGQLRHGLQQMREVRTQRTTSQFLRQQERNKMTTRLRAQVLKRDQSRCQMCGTTPGHGATMHIDHITPVSRGGTTTIENLQTLCQDCNLGKSNVL